LGNGSKQAQNVRSRIIRYLVTPIKPSLLYRDIYAEIANQCTHIIHCAGVVRMNLALEVARQHALGSAQNIVELALACQTSGSLQKIEYVSTVGVAGRMPAFCLKPGLSNQGNFIILMSNPRQKPKVIYASKLNGIICL